jgi:hypothetical protein
MVPAAVLAASGAFAAPVRLPGRQPVDDRRPADLGGREPGGDGNGIDAVERAARPVTSLLLGRVATR